MGVLVYFFDKNINHLEGKVIFTGTFTSKTVKAKFIDFKLTELPSSNPEYVTIPLPNSTEAEVINIKSSFANVYYIPNKINGDYIKGDLTIDNGANLVSKNQYYNNGRYDYWVYFTFYGKVTNKGNFFGTSIPNEYGSEAKITIQDYTDSQGILHYADYNQGLFDNSLAQTDFYLKTNRPLYYYNLENNDKLYGIYDPEGEPIIINYDLNIKQYKDSSTQFIIKNNSKLTINSYLGYINTNKFTIEEGSKLKFNYLNNSITTLGDGDLYIGSSNHDVTHLNGDLYIFGKGGIKKVKAKTIIYNFVPSNIEQENGINFQYLPFDIEGNVIIRSQSPQAYVLLGIIDYYDYVIINGSYASGKGILKGELTIEDGAYLTLPKDFRTKYGDNQYMQYYVNGKINKNSNGTFRNDEYFISLDSENNGGRLRIDFIDYTKPDGTVIYTNTQDEINEIMNGINTY